MINKIKSIYARRKAISPVIATILLIALTVAAVALVYFVLIPMFKTYKLDAEITFVSDTNKDSMYDEITLQMVNSGTQVIDIYNITIWICTQSDLSNPNNWLALMDWNFSNPNDITINPSDVATDVKISGEEQIILTVVEDTYARIEIMYYGGDNPLFIDWFRLNDYFDEVDLLIDFSAFELTATAFEGTINDPSRTANNYNTEGGDYTLLEDNYNILPVLNETDVLFWVGDSILIMNGQAPRGNLSDIPLVQSMNVSTFFRSRKFYILGLAGSWGDEFPNGDWSVRVTITYTDDSVSEWDLGHEYVDDWWYNSNPGHDCISAPYGYVTEIDLGNQIDTPHSHIHTHTTRFYIDFYKYVKSITFTDPGDDYSSAHILAITFR